MEEQELSEAAEEARRPEEKRVGLTMAIVAVLLAIATMAGHRLHTEEVVLQTRAADQWAYYQAKNTRSQMYGGNAKLAGVVGERGGDLTREFQQEAERERSDAEDIHKEAKHLEEETQATARRASYFDGSEIFLEIAIVLCSITLLTSSMLYWKLSFISSAAGVIIAVAGLVPH